MKGNSGAVSIDERVTNRNGVALTPRDVHRGIRCISRDQPWTEKAWQGTRGRISEPARGDML